MAGPWEAYQQSAPSTQDGPWTAFAAPDAGRSSATPSMGKLEAAGRGAMAGVSLNFGDELAGLWQASGIPALLGKLSPEIRGAAVQALLSSPMGAGLALGAGTTAGAARLAGDALMGGGDASAAYAEGRDASRAALEQARKDQPAATLTGEVGGGLLLPVGGALQAATLPARIARGAAVGAGIGGVSGMGEGTTAADRAAKGATGVALGGALGGAGVPAVELGVAGAGKVLQYPANLIRSAFNPTGQAERAIGKGYIDAVKADPTAANRLTPSEVTAGGPAVVMDVLGQPGRNLARSAANISGEARDKLTGALDPRFKEQVPRLTSWLDSTFHYPNAEAQQEALRQSAKTVNNARYGQAYKDGSAGIWDQELAELSQAPAIQDAVKAATKQAQNRSAPDVSKGPSIMDRWVTKDDKPTLEFWDLVKRQVDQEINVAKRAGRNEDVMELTAIKSKLVEKLDAAVPSYGAARQGASHFFGADHALEAGQKFVTENFNNAGTRKALAQMSPTERQLFQDGFVSEYIKRLETVSDRADIVKRIYQDPANREKFAIALGPQRSKELEAILRVEGIMQQGLQGVTGNSSTILQATTLGLAGAGGGAYTGFDPTTSGVLAAALTAGKKGLDQRVASRVADLLTSKDPTVLRRGVTMAANSQTIMGALRAVDAGASKIAGQQAPNVPALQAAGIGRAEEQQP